MKLFVHTFIHFLKVEALRAFGGSTVQHAVRKAWKETMTDGLLAQFSWTGQVKSTNNKDAGLVLSTSKLAMTIFGTKVNFGYFKVVFQFVFSFFFQRQLNTASLLTLN